MRFRKQRVSPIILFESLTKPVPRVPFANYTANTTGHKDKVKQLLPFLRIGHGISNRPLSGSHDFSLAGSFLDTESTSLGRPRHPSGDGYAIVKEDYSGHSCSFPPLRYKKFSACRSWTRPEGRERAIPIHSALLVRDITLSTTLTVFHPLTRGKELQIDFVSRRKHALISRTAVVVSCVGLGCQEQHQRL
ncbi:unnamed protein product [Lupinus luteus]|uniref:Uncharacterized protein n=1 Tax=Lupinus luteus TaxID=3873 RepID=A0AAV1XT69_LUPLU